MINEKKSLKELRARKNMTQQEVAQDLGVSVQTYCAWEKDLSNVGVSKVMAIASYFDTDIEGLIFTPLT